MKPYDQIQFDEDASRKAIADRDLKRRLLSRCERARRRGWVEGSVWGLMFVLFCYLLHLWVSR